MSFTATRLDEIEKRGNWIPVRDSLGIRAFGINAWRQPEPGEYVIAEHTEVMARHEELYVVVEGHATFTVNGEEIDAPVGTLVFVSDPDATRSAKAKEAGTTVLVVGARPGAAFETGPWEETWRENQEAMALYREQRYDEAAGVLREAVERYPDAAGIHYNLACFESLAGDDPETVVGHLQRAIDLYPQFRALARQDSDFEPVRGREEFATLVKEER